MKKDRMIAVIDIGSHSIKAHIAETGRSGKIKPLEYLWVPIAIGRDTFSRGTVSNSTIHEAINVIKNFKEVIDSYQVLNYRAVATSSIREAGNADVLIDRVYKATGVRIEVVQPIEETEAIYDGTKAVLKDRFGMKKKNFLFFSVSGGSTEIVLHSAGRLIFSESHHLGTLKLIKDFDFNSRASEIILRPFSMAFSSTINRFPDIKKIDSFIAINDDLLPLIEQQFPDNLQADVYQLDRQEFLDFFKKMEVLSLEDLKEKYRLNDNVLKTTRVALLMVGMFFNLTRARTILFPNVSSSYFQLYRLAHKVPGSPIDEDTRQNILSSALAIGRKYQFDEDHAREVARLGLSIFDQLRDHYDFTPRERIYLEVASLLHDIGSFISSSSHNKHSAQLIMSSEIIGLSASEMRIIALVARYHRKSPPKPSHADYSELPTEERLTVSRLSAVIRIADALDNTHNQIVDRLHLRLDNDHAEIGLKFRNNQHEYLDILKMAVKKKSDLFESFFGASVRLERMI